MLYDEEFLVEDTEDLNLMAKINSDFLRADVNFLLIHVESNHIFKPQHIFESGKKLALMNIPGGIYRLLIFTQNC